MDPYMQPRRAFSGGLGDPCFQLDAAAVSQTLISAYTNKPPAPVEQPLYHSIHIQRLKIVVKSGSNAKTWQFKASGGSTLASMLDMSVTGVVHSFDFGSQGRKLPAGENFAVDISAAGAAADIYVEGFQEQLRDPI